MLYHILLLSIVSDEKCNCYPNQFSFLSKVMLLSCYFQGILFVFGFHLFDYGVSLYGFRWFIQFEIHSASWICRFIFFVIFKKFLAIIFSSTFQSCPLFSLVTPGTWMSDIFMMSHLSLRLCSFLLQSIFFPLFRLGNFYSIFMSIDSFLWIPLLCCLAHPLNFVFFLTFVIVFCSSKISILFLLKFTVSFLKLSIYWLRTSFSFFHFLIYFELSASCSSKHFLTIAASKLCQMILLSLSSHCWHLLIILFQAIWDVPDSWYGGWFFSGTLDIWGVIW